jgi:hypothetical protein
VSDYDSWDTTTAGSITNDSCYYHLHDVTAARYLYRCNLICRNPHIGILSQTQKGFSSLHTGWRNHCSLPRFCRYLTVL